MATVSLLFTITLTLLCLKECTASSTATTDLEQAWIEPRNRTSTLKKMFKGYDNTERPFYRVKPVNVDVEIMIASISHISEENMEFQADLYLSQVWQDVRLAFGQKEEYIILQGDNVNKIWLPDTLILNAIKVTKMSESRTVKILGNGVVMFSYRAQVTLRMKMNLRNYPMDQQELYIGFESYLHDNTTLHLRWWRAGLAIKEIPTFVFMSHSSKHELLTASFGILHQLYITVKAKRRVGYFVMQFFFPSTLCTTISWLPFWMDRYSIGDRVALEITTLLTVMFLSQYINSSMPKVSYVKAADLYILITFMFLFLAMAENVLVYLYRDDVRGKRQRQIESSVLENGNQKQRDVRPRPTSTPDTNQRNCTCWMERQEHVKSDISVNIDRVSRIAFPAMYAVFVASYFSSTLTYY